MSVNINLVSDVNPKPILDLNYSFATTFMLITAIRLQLFTHMDCGAKTLSSIAVASGASEDGVKRLLNGLWTIGLVERQGDCYLLSPGATKYLVAGKPEYIGEDTLAMEDMISSWSKLTEVVRDGTRHSLLDEHLFAGNYYAERAKGLFPLTYPVAQKLVRYLLENDFNLPRRVLDIGAGAASWSIALAEHSEDIFVTVNDLPPVMESSKEAIKEHGLERQFDFLPGDFEDLVFGTAQYDLIFLCNVCRFLGEERSRQLLNKLRDALSPGGCLVLADVMLDQDYQYPIFGLVLSLSMMVNTLKGDIYAEIDYRRWLKDEGFTQIQAVRLGGPCPILLASVSGQDR